MQWQEIVGNHDRYMDELRSAAFAEMKRLGEREKKMLGMLEGAGFKTGDLLERLSYVLDEIPVREAEDVKDDD